MAVRGATLLLWLLAAASCVYWGLKFTPARAASNMVAPVRPLPPTDPVAVARLLGATRAAPGPAAPAASLASRFTLLGVVSARSHDGVALIGVDGKPPRPYHVGAPIDESLVVQSVQPRQAVLANSLGGPPVLTLELPPIKH